MSRLWVTVLTASLFPLASPAAAADDDNCGKNHYILEPEPCRKSTVDSFRIRQLFSNQGGDYQFIELEEVAGKSDQDQFAGLTLTVTNRHGLTKSFAFPANLPNAVTAGKRVTIATRGLEFILGMSGWEMDFVMPDRFLPTDGGTIEFAGIDRWSFDALPSLGIGLVRTNGGVVAEPGRLKTFAGQEVTAPGRFTVVHEYFNADLGNYFISGSQPDIDALDTGRIPGWKRTGASFAAPSAPDVGYGSEGSLPVCRYYVPPGSFFFSVSAEECDGIAKAYPHFSLETLTAFAAWPPDSTDPSRCPSHRWFGPGGYGLLPVYRLWNGRAATNHRYTTSAAVRDDMVDRGWVSEGVALCVPAGSPAR